jgi:hypothetical protein
MSDPYRHPPRNQYGYSPNPYSSSQSSHSGHSRPVPATPATYSPPPTSSKTISLDTETFKRFKNLELNHVTVTSSMEHKIRDLSLENQRIMETSVTKDSIITELEAQKKRVYDDLVRERAERQSEREQWARTVAKNPGFDVQQYNQVLEQLRREREANAMLDSLIKKEREANRMLDSKIQEIVRNQTYTAQHGAEQVNLIQKELEVEKLTNQEMERRLGAIKKENETLKTLSMGNAGNEIEKLKSELAAEKNSNMELDHLVQDLKQQIVILGNGPRPADVEGLKAQIIELGRTVSDERHRFELALRQKTTEIGALQREISNLQQDSISVRNISDKYEQQIRQLNIKINEEQQRSWDLNEECRKMNAELEKLRSSLASSDPSQKYVRKAQSTGGKSISKLPPKGVDPELWLYFTGSDKSATGDLDAEELRVALSNGKWPPLTLKSAWYLLRIPERGGDFASIESFCSIWEFVEECKKQFILFDQTKQSETLWGQISAQKLEEALKGLGIKIPSKALSVVLKKRDQESVLI